MRFTQKARLWHHSEDPEQKFINFTTTEVHILSSNDPIETPKPCHLFVVSAFWQHTVTKNPWFPSLPFPFAFTPIPFTTPKECKPSPFTITGLARSFSSAFLWCTPPSFHGRLEVEGSSAWEACPLSSGQSSGRSGSGLCHSEAPCACGDLSPPGPCPRRSRLNRERVLWSNTDCVMLEESTSTSLYCISATVCVCVCVCFVLISSTTLIVWTFYVSGSNFIPCGPCTCKSLVFVLIPASVLSWPETQAFTAQPSSRWQRMR